ncbi:hypothetical protein [Sphingomonas pseudosanguinis]|uniref:Uncharacterized protein n=1 Tax=Sphingomonas pseudosanguinis TaxID=413712 RepID=A0A7W6A8S0_9SPHN|nr:hypothetical protein [Sphingomonas pseudosanguinis]MBB3878707.1 hypothetical protein [Sphingomonas pseudosanguinis]MBN3536040.1 hypothetical protein [Sphingomonas pseudosanguinis]
MSWLASIDPANINRHPRMYRSSLDREWRECDFITRRWQCTTSALLT